MIKIDEIKDETIKTRETLKLNENINKESRMNILLDCGNDSNFEEIEVMNEYLSKNQPQFYENFELTEYVDSGSIGTVYKGKSKNIYNNQLYCFKFCIQKNKSKKPNKAKYHEIVNQKQLHHKYISQILAFYKINNIDYFSVCELGKYGNLDNFEHKFLKKNFLSESFINYLTKPILEALLYMKRKKFLHLDIKKGNIVLNTELNPLLIDFSSTFPFKNYQPNDVIIFPMLGTGRYMSPEMLNRTKIEVKYGEKLDVYSLGVTLYNLAFGKYPYDLNKVSGNEYAKMAEQINNSELEFPKGIAVSKKFENFLRKILEKDYKKRYSLKEALEDPWIKGWDIINEEKENTAILENFIIKLISDNIPKFNQYLKENNSKDIYLQEDGKAEWSLNKYEDNIKY